MTLVLASRCVDGVVVVADRKITRLDTFELLGYDEKTSGVIRNVIFGYAGSSDFYKIFVRYVVGDLAILRDDPERYTYENMIQKFCAIMDIFRKVRGNNTFTLDVLVARLSPTRGQSDLFLVRDNGKQQQILEWRAIGSGELGANKIVSKFWNHKIDMKYFAERAYSIIKYFEEAKPKLRVGLGGGIPSIKYLENGAEIDTSPNDNKFTEFEDAYPKHKEEFKRILDHAEP